MSPRKRTYTIFSRSALAQVVKSELQHTGPAAAPSPNEVQIDGTSENLTTDATRPTAGTDHNTRHDMSTEEGENPRSGDWDQATGFPLTTKIVLCLLLNSLH